MRRVLVLAYYFPPLGGSGVQRITKFVKYLPRAGWQADVLSPTPGRYVARDPSLLDDMADWDGEVIRTRTLDPSRLGSGVAGAAPKGDRQRRWARALTGLFFLPDNKVGWGPFALHEARKRIEQTRYDAILSTAPPYTSHLVAARLGASSGLPVVLDYRDDWIGNPRHRYPTSLHLALHRRAERYALHRAALVTAINETIALAVAERAGGSCPVEVLAQGYDPEDFEGVIPPSTSERMRFVYTGVFYDEQRPDVFLRAFAQATARMDGAGAEAVFAGLVPPYFAALVDELGISDRVTYIGYQPHRRSVRLARSADVLWMIIGVGEGAEQISTSKVFEYMGTRLPVLALVPPGEAERALRAYGPATIVPPDDIQAVEDAILMHWRAWKEGRRFSVNQAFIDAHNRIHLAQRLGALLDAVVRGDRAADS